MRSNAGTAFEASAPASTTFVSWPSNPQHRAALENRIVEAVRRLPPRFRTVFLLRYIQHLNPDEISACLGISKRRVFKRLTKSLRLCHQYLGDLLDPNVAASGPGSDLSQDDPLIQIVGIVSETGRHGREAGKLVGIR